MKKLSIVTQTSVGRAAIGFVGTATVLLGTPLLSPDASAAMSAAQVSSVIANSTAV